jgi:hypothetical protein
MSTASSAMRKVRNGWQVRRVQGPLGSQRRDGGEHLLMKVAGFILSIRIIPDCKSF